MVMNNLLAVLMLTLAPVARAELPLLLNNADIARISAARTAERLHCANLITQSIETERRSCVERSGCNERPTIEERTRCLAEAGCASLRSREMSAMTEVRLNAGGIRQGYEAYTLGVMAAGSCPAVFALPTPSGDNVVELVRARQDDGGVEFIVAIRAQREIRVRPPTSGAGSQDDLLDDIQRRAEDLLGYDVTPRLRCGISEREVLDFHYRNGQVILGTDDVAFAGCVWSSRGHGR
jgi:hypothetical protein